MSATTITGKNIQAGRDTIVAADVHVHNVAAAIDNLGGRVVLAPPVLGDWGLVGRGADLVRLHEILEAHDSAAVVPVTGLGGLGKTALAAGYVAGYGQEYELIAWVKAERPDLIPGQYRQLVRIRTGQDVDETDAVAAAKAVFADTEGWLVVFDNATDRDALQPFLPSGSGRGLVTTRDETWSANPGRVLAIDPLPDDTVVAWLTDALEGTQDGAAIEEIAERLGGLPLAITQAIAFINARPGETAASYLDKLTERDGQRLVFGTHRPPGYPEPLATTWDISITQLATDTPAAVDLLNALSYISPDGLAITLLDGLIDGADMQDLLYVLRRYGVIRANATELTIHRLVQGVTRCSHTPEDTAGHIERWATHFGSASPDPEDHDNFSYYNSLTPHLLALLDHATEHDHTAIGLASAANETGISLKIQAAFTTAQAVLEHAVAIKEEAYGRDHPEVAITLTNLGTVHQELGEHRQARELLERAIAIKEVAYGRDHVQVAAPLMNLGNVHKSLAEYARAHRHYERALAIFEAAYGPDHPQVASTLGALGIVLDDLGEHGQARNALEDALAMFQAAYGPDHPQVATALGNLGNVYRTLGEHGQARIVLERAVAIFEAAYGPDHPQIGTTLTNLGTVHQKLGEHRQARELLERALGILKAAYGPDHPHVAIALTNLGTVHRTLRQRQRAREHYERALGILKAAYGPDHPQALHTRRLLTEMDAPGW